MSSISYMILSVTVTFFFPEINETICWLKCLGKSNIWENVTFFLTKISPIHCSYTRNRIETNKMFDQKDPNVNYRTRDINEKLIRFILVFFIAMESFLVMEEKWVSDFVTDFSPMLLVTRSKGNNHESIAVPFVWFRSQIKIRFLVHAIYL